MILSNTSIFFSLFFYIKFTIISFFLFLILSSPSYCLFHNKHKFQDSIKGSLMEEKTRLGSMPPSCYNKCNQCHPCMAAQVPTSPSHNRAEPSRVKDNHNRDESSRVKDGHNQAHDSSQVKYSHNRAESSRVKDSQNRAESTQVKNSHDQAKSSQVKNSHNLAESSQVKDSHNRAKSGRVKDMPMEHLGSSSPSIGANRYSNYKPLEWKCRCHDHFYNP